MSFRKSVFFSAIFSAAIALSASGAGAQSNCTASQSAAIKCFVSNAVATKITATRHGMTLADYESYGVSVNAIIQSDHTYLVLVGISSAVADAMPPTNADGSANASAQNSAIGTLVSRRGGRSPRQYDFRRHHGRSSVLHHGRRQRHERQQQLPRSAHPWRLAPHHRFLRRLRHHQRHRQLDRSQHWHRFRHSNMVAAKMIHIPPGVSEADIKSFAQTLGKAIYNYKVATKRTTL